MGKAAPAEHIIATICAVVSFTFLPQASPMFHRLSRGNQKNVLLALLAISAITTMVLGGFVPRYNAKHPKRVAMQYSHNVRAVSELKRYPLTSQHTSNQDALRLAFLDSGHQLGLVPAIHKRYGLVHSPARSKVLTDYTPDWDIIYPISAFLDGYEFDLPTAADFEWPKMQHEVVWKDEEDQRRVQLTLDFVSRPAWASPCWDASDIPSLLSESHLANPGNTAHLLQTGLVWPTIAFEAEILDWSFDFPPPKAKKRHHIKIVTTKLEPVVRLELVLREKGKVKMDWTAAGESRYHVGSVHVKGLWRSVYRTLRRH